MAVKSVSSVVGGGYDEFWTTRKYYRVVKGSKGPKKSKTTALWYVYHMMKYPDANVLCVRRYKSTLRDSCYTDFMWAADKLGVSNLFVGTVSPLRITYAPTGQTVLFVGMDDPQKVASISVTKGYLCWVWFEEFSQITNEADFDKIDFSIRGYIPPETGLFKQITCTFNPWSEHTWIKPRFFDNPDRSRIFSATTTYKVNEFLDAADVAKYEEIYVRNPRLARIICDGDWGVAEGLIYENWEVEDFDLDRVMREHPDARTTFGLDFGYKISFNAFIAVLVDVKEHELWIYDEYYSKGVSNIEIARKITEMGYSKEEIYADAAEPKSITELRNGLLEETVEGGSVRVARWQLPRIVPALKGPDSVRYGITTLQGFRMHVLPKCENTIMELSVYCYDTNAEGQFIDRPLKENDHLCLVGDTLVETLDGPKPIRDIRVGDMVWTRAGPRAVMAWAKTSDDAEIWTLETEDGHVLRGTADHRIPTAEGVKNLGCISNRDEVFIWDGKSASERTPRSSSTTGSYGTDMCGTAPARKRSITGIIRSISTGMYGRSITALYQRGTRSITRTAIPSTTTYPTSNACPSPSIGASIPAPTSSGSAEGRISRRSRINAGNGTGPRKGTSGMSPMWGTISGRRRSSSASGAIRCSSPRTWAATGSAQTPASPAPAGRQGWTTRTGSALSAEPRSGSTSTPRPSVAQRNVRLVSGPTGREAVYSMTVEGEHEYFADGILVCNCDALRYSIAKFFMKGKGRVVEAKGDEGRSEDRAVRSKRVFSA